MIIAFVCSGNICRSPLAEAIAGTLDPAGVRFTSAGTIAIAGQPASPLSIEVGAELGVDLSRHRSQTLDDLEQLAPDHLFAMEPHHLAELATRFPHWEERMHLLDPQRTPISDPYGRSIVHYREARDRIAEAIEARAADWAG